ncbi:MAG TPA: NfeD family protein [Candidatus Butyricicoccus avistercoris]|uniref:NfeD family protein n=1 Tax=Candidatus Butyricicoccus avistercoris TaxID=2838518 RepID=A0A9D1PGB6_9FIRM|nr:NfeD family protein [Candidatus Butyricicoccus avistercoris]
MPQSELGYTVIWIAILIGGVAIEVATLNLVSIWFAVGGLAAFIALSLGAGFLVQLIVFAIVSAIMLGLIRPLAKDILKPKGAKTNADRIIGQFATVTEQISNASNKGQIKVSGQIWSAKSDDGKVINEGETVKIIAIQGVKAVVEPLRKED